MDADHPAAGVTFARRSTLIALLNIFRVHYNFFEARPYSSPFGDGGASGDQPKLASRALRIPGTSDTVELNAPGEAKP